MRDSSSSSGALVVFRTFILPALGGARLLVGLGWWSVRSDVKTEKEDSPLLEEEN
jgi:hypothetical protein